MRRRPWALVLSWLVELAAEVYHTRYIIRSAPYSVTSSHAYASKARQRVLEESDSITEGAAASGGVEGRTRPQCRDRSTNERLEVTGHHSRNLKH